LENTFKKNLAYSKIETRFLAGERIALIFEGILCW